MADIYKDLVASIEADKKHFEIDSILAEYAIRLDLDPDDAISNINPSIVKDVTKLMQQ